MNDVNSMFINEYLWGNIWYYLFVFPVRGWLQINFHFPALWIGLNWDMLPGSFWGQKAEKMCARFEKPSNMIIVTLLRSSDWFTRMVIFLDGKCLKKLTTCLFDYIEQFCSLSWAIRSSISSSRGFASGI